MLAGLLAFMTLWDRPRFPSALRRWRNPIAIFYRAGCACCDWAGSTFIWNARLRLL